MLKIRNKFIIAFLFTFMFASFSFISFADTPIRNKPQSTQSQAVQWLEEKNAEQELIDLVPFIYEYSEEVGVEPTLVIAQISLETNFFKSDLCKSNHNTSGMKNVFGGYKKFDTYEDGIKAEIDHLNLYAGYPQDSKSWLKGWCTTIEGLTGRWAEDKRYSEKLLSMINQIQEYEKCTFYEDELEVKKELKKDDKKEDKKTTENNTKKNDNLIYQILNRKKVHSKGYQKLMDFLK